MHRQFGAQSQMAEGLLRRLAGNRFEVHSAGTAPSSVRAEAVEAMREVGIDLTSHRSKGLDEFEEQTFDFVITVCDNARESSPMFPGAGQMLHWPFEDPAAERGSAEARLSAFRSIRNQIAARLVEFAGGVEIRPALLQDQNAVSGLLTLAGVPALDGTSQFGAQYAIAEVGGTIVGAAGVEIHGGDGLLRSVAVDPVIRSQGLGRRLANERIEWARANRLRSLWLLTDTAAGYWERFGFKRADREKAPDPITHSTEWSALCPASATAMQLPLGADQAT